MIYHQFSKSSLKKLALCHDDLVRVAHLALIYSPYDFGIGETLRTTKRQAHLVATGKSLTMDSMHLANEDGVSEALDIKVYVKGKLTWDIGYYRKVAQAFFRAAIELNIQIEWGGLWRTLVDGPHYQLRKEAN